MRTGTSDSQMADTALQFVRSLLVEAGNLALVSRRDLGDAQLKADETPVTQVDRDIETLLVEHIRREFPQHRILAEEGSQGGSDADFTWIIDPLDGTRAYISGLPIWGISVGLLRYEKPLAGAFFLPAVNELYWGDGQSAFLNGQRLPPPVFGLDSLHAFLAVPSNCHLEYEISFGRLRSLGSTAAHLIYVARGAAIGALTRRVRLWDLAGVLPILAPLGIELRYLSGASFRVGDLMEGQRASEPIVAGPTQLIDPLLAMIRRKPAGQ
jgi:fructose-1,6-bisphosphatase/inositol monophosphatase family enzyme